MPQICLTGTITCTIQEIDILRNALPEHIRLTRAERGCLYFAVTQDVRDPTVFHVEERFADQAAFDAHQARTKSTTWFTATQHMTRNYEIRLD
ncbi:putative quinol monooxygenase [Qingshengfaniella alkalisoli]|uniref:Antibiotic biosynthesis monooxygenase n=1 Tax=Qingshengfaniella alkalisoli TaxID=2599296 RepID=A0A5B8J376_9RHOB|nr:antibiotic biosynthesis monooxygenase [Qingshengfaniella alkalisoli]QDY68937.1 antibiotic biosynthesis monooxygenase [Qingshengfaniella alkalisoli]